MIVTELRYFSNYTGIPDILPFPNGGEYGEELDDKLIMQFAEIPLTEWAQRAVPGRQYVLLLDTPPTGDAVADVVFGENDVITQYLMGEIGSFPSGYMGLFTAPLIFGGPTT